MTRLAGCGCAEQITQNLWCKYADFWVSGYFFLQTSGFGGRKIGGHSQKSVEKPELSGFSADFSEFQQVHAVRQRDTGERNLTVAESRVITAPVIEIVNIGKAHTGADTEFAFNIFFAKIEFAVQAPEQADICFFKIVISVEQFVVPAGQFDAVGAVEEQACDIRTGEGGEAAAAAEGQFGIYA
ncbi:MAG: hypothetical protein ACR2K1_01010 [Saprospiraceae bacterium]